MGAGCSKRVAADEPRGVARDLHRTSHAHSGGDAGPSAAALQALPPSPVKVAVVVRPLLPFEQQKGCRDIVDMAATDRISLQASSSSSQQPGGAEAPADFQFDRVYQAADARASRRMYAEMVAPVVSKVSQGYNGCVLAYGQTGSGKTHQMGGHAAAAAAGGGAGGGASSSASVLALACGQLLQYMQDASATYALQLKVTFIEIYNEAIQDLLAPSAAAFGTAAGLAAAGGNSGSLAALRAVYGSGGSGSSPGSPRASAPAAAPGVASRLGADSPAAAAAAAAAAASGGSTISIPGSDSSFSSITGGAGGSSSGITMYENAAGQIVIDGATEVLVASAADIAAALQRGSAARATAAHKLNQQSSRSHAIFTLSLRQRAHARAAPQLPPETRCLDSKLHLVDLAGSERVKETGTTGARFAEGVSINRGLLELGNVINALTEGAARKHIPYRNSKLTRLLQDSLGGSAETCFLACVSPADANREHTLSTLRYASRAMAIKNSVVRAAMSPGEELAYLRELVAALQAENAALKAALGGAGGGGVGGAQQQQQQQQQQQAQKASPALRQTRDVNVRVQAC